MRDLLTGVEDRAALKAWRQEIDTDSRIVLMMLDVDHVKSVNDRFGHEVGDALLEAVGQTLRRLVDRYKDARAFRFGGDEFVVVLTDFSLDEGVALARTIASAVMQIKIESMDSPTLTIGVTSSDLSKPTRVLEDADFALLEGKRQGRNRIQVFDAVTEAIPLSLRRLILNPSLFAAKDKTLRIAFVRTSRLEETMETIRYSQELPIRCLRVLGETDLLIFHQADSLSRFLADVQEITGRGENDRPWYFQVSSIRKFHGYVVDEASTPRLPSMNTLRALVDAAEDASGVDERQLKLWLKDSLVLGLETSNRLANEVDAYIIVDLQSSSEVNPIRQLFDLIVREDLLPNRHVTTLYEGSGAMKNAQFIIHFRSTLTELFEFIEILHERSRRLLLPSLRTNTYLVVSEHGRDRRYRALLTPLLTEQDKYVRDALILPALRADERAEYLASLPEVQLAIIRTVAELDDAFAELQSRNELSGGHDDERLRRHAMHAVIVRDLSEIRHIYMDLWGIIDSALRQKAVESVRMYFPDPESAVDARILSSHMRDKPLEKLTFGEVRDILRSFHHLKHEATATLPPLFVLDSLSTFVDFRNRLVHGEADPPERATEVLVDFVRFLAMSGWALLGRRDASRA